MQSESVACNLQFDLQTSGKLIFSCFNIKDQADYITDADENNLIIIFQNQEPILIVFFQEPSHSKVTKETKDMHDYF